ncbi:DUF423 domain-containing protein [Ferrimonas balearica]|uniref:DUF423 domain-containing protein n=1 Tax=Ferrimonas balearica TaxID=44012 RepID=UPI001C956A6E|nr:DUF423 domain-containing protein [Ferrimonas balearica]MBY5980122.1 DUF423 domain-containing protein [Ferrimonas balearica]MBY6093780.1 DUF423 domain-containing protein [Ferrimonas balearica]
MSRLFLLIAALLGLLATGLGAYGAHGLPGKVSPHLVDSFNTAVQYQFFHALALMAIGLWLMREQSRLLVAAGIAMILGMLGFSGSIYALVLLGSKGFGPITPMGGMTLMVGWGLLAVMAMVKGGERE